MAPHVRVPNEESSAAKALRVGAIEPLWDDGEYVLHRAVPEGGVLRGERERIDA